MRKFLISVLIFSNLETAFAQTEKLEPQSFISDAIVELSSDIKDDIQCRGSKIKFTVSQLNFAVKAHLLEQLKLTNYFSQSLIGQPDTISKLLYLRIKEIDLTTNLNPEWKIKASVKLGSRAEIEFESKYPFEGNFLAVIVCNRARDAMVLALANLAKESVNKTQQEINKDFYAQALQKQFSAINDQANWADRVTLLVSNRLREWLEQNLATNLLEIKLPDFPPALNLTQNKWETNKEFEDRIQIARIDRQKEIEQIQGEYRARVDKRNSEIQIITQARLEKEKQLPAQKKELLKQTLQDLNLQIDVSEVNFDQQSGTLFINLSIGNAGIERYAFKDAPLQVRRDALTLAKSLTFKPDFFITDDGQFGIKSISMESSGIKVTGTPSQANAAIQSLRLATIDVPISNLPALTQQSAITVDKNQVEQILYRDENESLRKRLEEQRKAQEIALAEETRKVAVETAKLRAESETLRQRQRELESQLASGSKTPINYGKALNAHALIIGNASYGGSAKLPNPINDAKAMWLC